MVYVIIEQRIIDWPEFEHLFRGDVERRKIIGSKGAKVLRDPNDGETVVVYFEWEDLDKARKFVAEWEATVPWCRCRVLEEIFSTEG